MANEYLTRTPTSTGNQRVWTWSGWVKRNTLTDAQHNLWRVESGSSGDSGFRFDLNTPADSLRLYLNGASNGDLQESAKRRDIGSWIHVILVYDSTATTSSSRVQLYINGTRVRSFSTETYPTINYIASWNGLVAHRIGASPTYSEYSKLELADIFFVDGQALTPDVFGFYKQGKGYISAGSTQSTDFRPGQWVPKTPRVIKTEINRRGGFGVNGFYLPMNDSRNFGADFHGEPNSIITLNEKLPQPRVGVATTATVGLGYTDVLRADPYAANLVLALPFVSGGLSSGFGDYAPSIKGSGSAKVGTLVGNVSIANTAGYYGSAANFDKVDDRITFSSSSDFDFGTGDFTVEFWFNSRDVSNTTQRGFLQTSDTTGGLKTSYTSGIVIVQGVVLGSSGLAGAISASIVGSSVGSSAILSTNQWNHCALVRKTGTSTLYVNGVAVGINTTTTGAVSGTNLVVGGYYDTNYLYDGYIQDLRIYKGVAKYTGGFDVPRPYTPVGIATWRAVPDCTANNFCTWNPISPASDVTYTNGNLTVTYGSANVRGVVVGTIGVAVTGGGKYYWENRIDASSVSPTQGMISLCGMGNNITGVNGFYAGFDNSYGWSYYGGNGNFYYASGGTGASVTYGATFTTGDIIGVSLDMTTSNGTLTFYKNGVSQGVATTGIGTFLSNGNIHAIVPALSDGSTTNTYTASSNFGQNPTFSGNTTAGTFTDSNGKGLFKYQPPSGFLALCEDNLPTPAISDPGKHFKTVLYSGSSSASQGVVGVGFTPDLVWIKHRTSAGSGHIWTDSVRGAGKAIFSFATNAEDVLASTGYLSSFDNDGFSLSDGSSSGARVKADGAPYVAWCWRAGAGTTSTNTNGSITSVVSVNQTAGFSIVTFTANTGSGSIGHGLGVPPKMIIIKSRNNPSDWVVYHASLGAGRYLNMNKTDAAITNTFTWQNTTPTNTVFYSNGPFIAGWSEVTYCWAEIEGFSKFGSYVGNGSADGPFVYCGFKPAWIMVKCSSSDQAGNAVWSLWDTSRNAYNVVNNRLQAQSSAVESSDSNWIDILSNGFKIRETSTAVNANSATYIFAAFAESPFQTANSK